jgi:hypothetical protein
MCKEKEMSKEIYEKLTEPFPKEAMTKDSSRGFDLTSIKAQYVRERLNLVLGVDGWSTNTDVVDRTDKGVAVKMTMTLHIDGKDVTRSAFGGASVKTKGQTYGDVFKSAETDALSKAASNFGVGNDVFKGLVNAKTLTTKASTPAVKTTSTTKSATVSKPSFRRPTKAVAVEVAEIIEDEDDI